MSDPAPAPFVEPQLAVRQLPELTLVNEFFWTSGADGRLRFLRCTDCGFYLHPPGPRCPQCLSESMAPTVVAGRATVVSFTVNHHAWVPGASPYAIAIVELEEQTGLRLTTQLIDCALDAVAIGMKVTVVFEPNGDVFVPLFRPEVS